jgi:hypothetical protein
MCCGRFSLYFVELVDLRGGVVRLDLEVTVEEFEPPEVPRVRPAFLAVPSANGRATFIMTGPDVGLFSRVRPEADEEEETDGIRIRMERPRGRTRRAHVHTTDASPGTYALEILDAQGTAVPLRMRVRVFELAAPPVEPDRIQLTEDENSADFEMKGLGLNLFEEIRLMDADGNDVDGLSITMEDRVTRNRRSATVSLDDGAEPGTYSVVVLDGEGEAYELELEIEVDVQTDEGDTGGVADDDQFSGDGGASSAGDVDTKVVGKDFTVEINGQFIPTQSYSGGNLQAETAEASSGSSQHNESTMGHNYITELTLTAFFTSNTQERVIPNLVMEWIQETGEPVDVTITELAKDKSVVKTYLYLDCVPVSYVPPRVAANAGEMLKHQLTLKPVRLEVSSAEPNPEEFFAPEARDLLYSFLEALVPSAEAAQTESDQMIFSKYFELEVVGIDQSVPGAVSVLPGTVYWSIEEATRGTSQICASTPGRSIGLMTGRSRSCRVPAW